MWQIKYYSNDMDVELLKHSRLSIRYVYNASLCIRLDMIIVQTLVLGSGYQVLQFLVSLFQMEQSATIIISEAL